MDLNEKIVCDLFGVKGAEFVAKPRLIRALAVLNTEYEKVYVDLYRENPCHFRFDKFTALDLASIKERAEKDVKKTQTKFSLWLRDLRCWPFWKKVANDPS